MPTKIIISTYLGHYPNNDASQSKDELGSIQQTPGKSENAPSQQHNEPSQSNDEVRKKIKQELLKLKEEHRLNDPTMARLEAEMFYFYEKPQVRVAELRAKMQLSPATITHHISFLKDLGWIEFRGARVNGWFVLSEKAREMFK